MGTATMQVSFCDLAQKIEKFTQKQQHSSTSNTTNNQKTVENLINTNIYLYTTYNTDKKPDIELTTRIIDFFRKISKSKSLY